MKFAHLSDLHFGHHDEAVSSTLVAELARQELDLVVVSGDFTQRGTEAEFAVARAFIDSLDTPVFAVPGNHDVPQRNLWRRFIDPYAHYRQYIAEDLEPYLELGGVAFVGLKTPHRAMPEFNWSQGSFGRRQLADLARRFEQASPSALRVVVAHHPLLTPETEMSVKMQRVRRADLALQTFASLGVRLVLSGHFHLSYVRVHTAPGSITTGAPTGLRAAAAAPILVAQTSSTISTRLRGHANAYNLISIADAQIDIAVREWNGETWVTKEQDTRETVQAGER